ncbi:MAG: PadR family transcriptional regulator [Oscillospiraceae bacterium]
MPAKNTSGTPMGIRESLKKATTEMLVLFLLRQKPMYTYEMMTTVERISEGQIAFNTLYQAIYRLQGFNYIEESSKVLSDSNRVRIFYLITEPGQKYLDELIAGYHTMVDTINSILSLDGKIVGQEDIGERA